MTNVLSFSPYTPFPDFEDGTDSPDCAVHEVLDTRGLQVEAESSLTAAEKRTLASRIEKAAAFGDTLQHWDDDAKWKSKLTATLLSDHCLSGLTGSPAAAVPGMTTGPDDIFLRRAALRGNRAVDAEVLAHELVHIQDWRMAGEAEPTIPLYLKEGKAYVVGLSYAKDAQRLKQVRDDLAQLTANDARWVVDQFRTDHPAGNPNASYWGELGGALFVEFLRAHVKKDALVRLANAVEACGRGQTFTAAIKKEFGKSLPELENAFVDFVEKTEQAPRERFKGTIFTR